MRPETVGRTLREIVEARERALGLRCDDVSCGLAPTDDDPLPFLSPAQKAKEHIRDAYLPGGGTCPHTFHLPCIVTAARVAEGSAARAEAVPCPVCRAEGSLDAELWAQGVRALEA